MVMGGSANNLTSSNHKVLVVHGLCLLMQQLDS